MKTIFLVICAFMAAAASPSHARNEADQLASEIRGLVANLACQKDQDCKSVGFGARACGGYESFLVYSAQTTDTKILAEKVLRYNSLQKSNNVSNGMASICAVEEDKPLACKQGLCVTVE